MTPYSAGDNFNPNDFPEGDDCPGAMRGGLPLCNLAKDHGGQHVAVDMDLRVVAVWS